jgi:hypothetical protein
LANLFLLYNLIDSIASSDCIKFSLELLFLDLSFNLLVVIFDSWRKVYSQFLKSFVQQ